MLFLFSNCLATTKTKMFEKAFGFSRRWLATCAVPFRWFSPEKLDVKSHKNSKEKNSSQSDWITIILVRFEWACCVSSRAPHTTISFASEAGLRSPRDFRFGVAENSRTNCTNWQYIKFNLNKNYYSFLVLVFCVPSAAINNIAFERKKFYVHEEEKRSLKEPKTYNFMLPA